MTYDIPATRVTTILKPDFPGFPFGLMAKESWRRIRLRLKTLLVTTIVVVSGTSSTFGIDIHVSPLGNDQNNGTETHPFVSLQRAQQAARRLAGHEAVTIWLHPGTYYLPEPLKLTHEDSGSQLHPVIYRGTENGVIISGGQCLDLTWLPHENGIFLAATPSGLVIDQLFVNGTRQHMARYPNFDPNVPHFNGFAADAFSRQRAANWKDPSGGFIHAMHRAHWGGYHYRITGKDENGEVTYEGGWQNNRQMGMHDQHRFVENIFEELDADGEWFHDAGNCMLYYKPADGVDLTTAHLEVVRLNQLIELEGTPTSPVQHIKLENLEFRHAARTFMDNREPLLRSDWTIFRGGAIFFDGAENCSVERCVFNQLGGNAVFINDYNRNIEIVGCHVHDAGGNGICFVGNPKAVRNALLNYDDRLSFFDIDRTPGPQSNEYPSKCLVENCLIERTGRFEKQTAGVQISMSSQITIRHCSIYEVPRAGINISEGTFGGHLIEFCDVFDTVLETGDHGSFNSWGRDRFWGLAEAPQDRLPELARLDMVNINIIRNSRWRCDHGWDIDLDDGSSNYHVYNNLMLSGGLKFREGFHRIAENNIMVSNSFHPHVWYRNSNDVFRKNIVFTTYRPIRVPVPWGGDVDHNLLHLPGAEVPSAASVLAGQSGRDEHSVVADARFANPEAGDFTVDKDSPALELGFTNFPMDRFGVQLPELKKLARTPAMSTGKQENPFNSRPSVTPKMIEHFWIGATIHDLQGEEFSSVGVSRDLAGVLLSSVPQNSDAAEFGFRQNDVIQKINDDPVRSVADLRTAQNRLAGHSMRVVIVRQQREQSLSVPRYSYFNTIQSNEPSFENLKVSLKESIQFKSVATRPESHNQPATVLGDRKLSRDYGPVFANETTGGIYKVSLGESYSIQSLGTVTFNENGNRGSQRYVIFGSNSLTDPGWDVVDRSAFRLIGEVDTTGQPAKNFQATEIRSSTDDLGEFRWLLWVVRPVTDKAENSAYQEFIVTGK